MWVPVESLIYSVEVWETEYCFIFIYLIKLYSINTYYARHCSKSFTNITRLLQPEHKSHLEKNSKCYKQMSQTYLGKASEMRARGWDGGVEVQLSHCSQQAAAPSARLPPPISAVHSARIFSLLYPSFTICPRQLGRWFRPTLLGTQAVFLHLRLKPSYFNSCMAAQALFQMESFFTIV